MIEFTEPTGPCVCQDCGLRYEADSRGQPITDGPYTCDDCGGYVGDIEESVEWVKEPGA